MALFGKKVLCPVCGAEVKGLMPVKIKGGVPICSNCSLLINMDSSMLVGQSPDDIKEHLKYRAQNQQILKTFNVTREQQVGLNYFFRVDEGQKLWYCAEKKAFNPAVFSFSDIIDYELTEDGHSVSKGGLGRAAVGGLLFGGVGAIVGGVTGGKKSQDVLESMKLRISLNNKYNTKMELEFIPPSLKCKAGSAGYKLYKEQASNMLSILDSICNQVEREQGVQAVATPAVSVADELLKFKQLLDAGAITEEEFNAMKKQLLGL